MFMKLKSKKQFFYCQLLVLSLTAHLYGGGFASLKMGADGRTGALGLASTAYADNGSASYWNPAGLAWVHGMDVLFAHHQWIMDVHGEFISFGYGGPKGGTGFHILYTGMGDLELRTKDPTPSPLGTFSAHELVAGVSYARKIAERLSLGINVKLFYEKIFIDEALGFGGDIGLLFQAWDKGLRIGSVIQNIGKTNKLRHESIALPLTWKTGISYPFSGLGGTWLVILDGVKEKDYPFHIHGGLEVGLKQLFFIRGGYQTGYETRGPSGGIGFIWHQYRIDYCVMMLNSGFGNTHCISLGIGFK